MQTKPKKEWKKKTAQSNVNENTHSKEEEDDLWMDVNEFQE